MPGGSPLAVHVNGAVPPFCTLMVRLHATPIVQSSSAPCAADAIDGSVAAAPTTSIDIVLV